MSGFLKIRDFFKKSVLWKTAEFSDSDTGNPLILTCLENSTRPLVFTSPSGCRASENFDISIEN